MSLTVPQLCCTLMHAGEVQQTPQLLVNNRGMTAITLSRELRDFMWLKHFCGWDFDWHNSNQPKTALISIPTHTGLWKDEETGSQGSFRADWQLWLYLRIARHHGQRTWRRTSLIFLIDHSYLSSLLVLLRICRPRVKGKPASYFRKHYWLHISGWLCLQLDNSLNWQPLVPPLNASQRTLCNWTRKLELLAGLPGGAYVKQNHKWLSFQFRT